MMEARNEIAELEAARKDYIAKRNTYVRKCEQANGLFGDTQADEGGLFPDENFMSPAYAKGMVDGYNTQIQRIEAKLAILKAALLNEDKNEQMEITFN